VKKIQDRDNTTDITKEIHQYINEDIMVITRDKLDLLIKHYHECYCGRLFWCSHLAQNHPKGSHEFRSYCHLGLLDLGSVLIIGLIYYYFPIFWSILLLWLEWFYGVDITAHFSLYIARLWNPKFMETFL
jgi:hypothetical protein